MAVAVPGSAAELREGFIEPRPQVAEVGRERRPSAETTLVGCARQPRDALCNGFLTSLPQGPAVVLSVSTSPNG